LKEKLIAPDFIAEFTRAYQEEVNRLAATATSRHADRERRLKAVERKIQAIMDRCREGPLFAQHERSDAAAGSRAPGAAEGRGSR
jgi:hypothetical protein